MKLLTHNLLMCNKKGCTINNFPLQILIESCSDSKPSYISKMDFDKDLIKKTIKKLDMPALTKATKDVSVLVG